jgi:hypothetical protein
MHNMISYYVMIIIIFNVCLYNPLGILLIINIMITELVNSKE